MIKISMLQAVKYKNEA